MIKPHVAAEAGFGPDDANRLTKHRMYGKLSNSFFAKAAGWQRPVRYKVLHCNDLYDTKYFIATNDDRDIKAEGRERIEGTGPGRAPYCPAAKCDSQQLTITRNSLKRPDLCVPYSF